MYKYKCASCGTVFHASGAPEMSYGEFVLRSDAGEEAFLEAVTNNAFNDVANIVRAHPSLKGASQARSGDVAQRIFGLTCDSSPSGRPFHIEMNPTCPDCSSRQMTSWREVMPQQTTDIPMVTHHRWDQMNQKEKEMFINKAIIQLS